MRSLLLVVLFLLSTIGTSGNVSAQVPDEAKSAVSEVPGAASSGSVTGSVVCEDTQRPARFARVVLVNRKTILVHAQRPLPDAGQATLSVNGTTGIDGRFQIEKVPSGDYYVLAKIEGYLFPIYAFDPEHDVQKAASHLDELMRGVPLVHVAQGHMSEANVTLHRGGLIAGRVAYDDGSPAVGIPLRLDKDGTPGSAAAVTYMVFRDPSTFPQPGMTITDDEGRFRFPGLLPGLYEVSAFLTVSGTSRMMGSMYSSHGADFSESTITVLYPSAFRGSDAKTLKIDSDERIADADITINLNGLHTVRGRVHISSSSPTALTTKVLLFEEAGADMQTGTHLLERNAALRADGSFELLFVPAGKYRLRIICDPENRSLEDGVTMTHYIVQDEPVSVVVLDQDLDVGEVAVLAPKEEKDSPSDALPTGDPAPKL